MPDILVVCTANICRSPVAEALLRARLEALDESGWRVASAGTMALPGYGPAEHSAAVLLERGLDVTAHRSRPAEERVVDGADLVLCMEMGHKQALQDRFPNHRDKVFLLTEMVGEAADVADPIGGPREDYERMVDEVSDLIDAGLARIVELASGSVAQRGAPRAERADEFTLYDLRVEVVACRDDRPMVCNHKIGDYFELSGENLSLPPGQTFPIYPLAALLPLLPAKQRDTHPNDWMTTDTDIACPDPHCGAIFRITRTRQRTFRHSEVTVVPLKREPD